MVRVARVVSRAAEGVRRLVALVQQDAVHQFGSGHDQPRRLRHHVRWDPVTRARTPGATCRSTVVTLSPENPEGERSRTAPGRAATSSNGWPERITGSAASSTLGPNASVATPTTRSPSAHERQLVGHRPVRHAAPVVQRVPAPRRVLDLGDHRPRRQRRRDGAAERDVGQPRRRQRHGPDLVRPALPRLPEGLPGVTAQPRPDSLRRTITLTWPASRLRPSTGNAANTSCEPPSSSTTTLVTGGPPAGSSRTGRAPGSSSAAASGDRSVGPSQVRGVSPGSSTGPVGPRGRAARSRRP
jgi:hypothetical protein